VTPGAASGQLCRAEEGTVGTRNAMTSLPTLGKQRLLLLPGEKYGCDY